MAETENKAEAKKELEVKATNTDKPSGIEVKEETTIAPKTDKPMDAAGDSPDTEDIDDIIIFLNSLDQASGGKGEIAEISDELRKPISYLVEVMTKIRQAYKDPMWEALVDDMNDQIEDGKTPSVEVAIARTIPLAKIQELADNEDYGSVQDELASTLEENQRMEDEDKLLEASFEETKKAGDEYAAEMGYDEERTNALFQKVLDFAKIIGDGVLTKAEFAEVDKMLNYDPDTESLKAQISAQPAKEILPDQASGISGGNIKTTTAKTNCTI